MKVSVGDVSVLLVPSSAVIQKGDKSLVFVDLGNGKFEQREVRTGVSDANNIEILSGLKPGERIVSQGGTEILGAAMKSSEGR
jgi:Cu(I)/Ag(I) efflux system membrane fusion protein